MQTSMLPWTIRRAVYNGTRINDSKRTVRRHATVFMAGQTAVPAHLGLGCGAVFRRRWRRRGRVMVVHYHSQEVGTVGVVAAVDNDQLEVVL